MSSALQTDRYELTMLQAAVRSGVADRPAVFEVLARRLPDGRRYGVVGGIGRLLDELANFTFGDAELAFLRRVGLDEPTVQWLRAHPVAVDVVAYREGELYFPGSPVLTVEGSFGQAVLLETIVLSVLNHDSAVASAAARMVDAAQGIPLIEMGTRRTHEDAAVSAARSAHLVGFAATSNLAAGDRYGVPTAGTAAHAFTLAHASEEEAFASQLDSAGIETTLLVDTYDVERAIRTAVRLAHERGAEGPGAIRIDSGDLVEEARRARALLDDLGATSTRIIVSSDLDEYLIEDLVERRAPVDGFGVGTSVVTGSGHPTASFVYKLVAVAASAEPDAPLRPVEKRSPGKSGAGGRKQAWRLLDGEGFAVGEEVAQRRRPFSEADGDDPRRRPLQVVAQRGGRRTHCPTTEDVRAHHRLALAELRTRDRTIVAGGPAITPAVEAAVVEDGGR